MTNLASETPLNKSPTSHAPPAVLTAAQRHELARQFADFQRLVHRSPPDFRGAHQILSAVCTLDPGNTHFVATLLANLQNAQGKTASAWFWQIWKLRGELASAIQMKQWTSALHAGWSLLGEVPSDAEVLRQLAQICESLDHGPTQIVLLRAARKSAPQNVAVLRPLALALSAAGQFTEAAEIWRQLLEQLPSDEQAKEFLRVLIPAKQSQTPAGQTLIDRVEAQLTAQQWDAAEQLLAAESGAAGASLELRWLGEQVMVGRARERTAIAQQLAELSPTPVQQRLVPELLTEQRRIELGVAFARYERFSSDATTIFDLAECLTRAGNFSEALKYLERIKADPAWRLRAQVAIGENWQQLRQFERALSAYQEALATPHLDPQNEYVQRGWHRGAVLAEALGQVPTAVAWLEQLVVANPAYKDAQARLDNLRAICHKG
ncbi:hypothetical protein [Anatilimnocola floriformis]|uniref:hypothetical protein n=1 Tax=Anatilimnocola floriformis TaxID=2948575 RepID=UPI0020C52A41|nr:hypothetical protein [Anatilimnocola floriformis]